jgi:hypothetical protein
MGTGPKPAIGMISHTGINRDTWNRLRRLTFRTVAQSLRVLLTDVGQSNSAYGVLVSLLALSCASLNASPCPIPGGIDLRLAWTGIRLDSASFFFSRLRRRRSLFLFRANVLGGTHIYARRRFLAR